MTLLMQPLYTVYRACTVCSILVLNKIDLSEGLKNVYVMCIFKSLFINLEIHFLAFGFKFNLIIFLYIDAVANSMQI